ncbi:MAG: branched-chain-amino-acid transaminase [Acidobacteriota bacterium]
MGLCIYLDGEFVDQRDEATVSLYDHGFLYGDGIFEGIRAYGGKVFRLDEHLRRLYDSARGIHLTLPISPEQMKDLVLKTCERTSEPDLYIRLIVSRGVGDLGIDPRKCTAGPRIYIIAGGIQLYAPEKYRDGLRVVTVTTRRNRPDSLPAQIKSLNYLNNIFGKIEANRLGADEGIMLNEAGYVAEATADNVFIVRDGELRTPAAHYGLLGGITRRVVVDLAREMAIPALEVGLVVQDLATADEMFLTGTGAELIPVVDFDGHPVGDGQPGPVFKRLLSAFRDRAAREGTPYLKAETSAPTDR